MTEEFIKPTDLVACEGHCPLCFRCHCGVRNCERAWVWEGERCFCARDAAGRLLEESQLPDGTVPRRVLLQPDWAVSAREAASAGVGVLAVVYRRDDGWTCGATQALADDCRRIWEREWVAVNTGDGWRPFPERRG